MSYSIDYRSFGQGDQTTKKDVTSRWWDLEMAKGEDIANSIAVSIDTLKQNQNKLDAQRSASSRLYGNMPLYGTLGLSTTRGAQTMPVVRDRLTYNVVQSCVDTVTAKMAKNKPKPFALTDDGDYRLQRRAKKMNKFTDGVFFANKAHSVQGPIAFRDAAVLGDGITHVFDYYGQVRFERVIPSEILVDEIEAINNDPRQLYRIKNVDRMALANKFPKHKEKIMQATRSMFDGTNIPSISDQVTCAEAWHLPSGPEAKDGRHIIAITGTTLFDEEYTDETFPFAFLPWCKRMYGFWSQGGVEQIQNIQLEINKLLWVIQRSMHLMGSFKIAVQAGSKIVSEHLNNEIGAILNFTGPTPPQYLLPPMVQPELYAHLATLKQAAYEQFGISQLSASSKKPEGLDSGKALREFNDIESERFMIIGQNYEQYYLDLARLGFKTARRIHKRKEKVSVKVPGSKFIETIDWSEVDLADDQFELQIFPISSLPSDPSGRLATIQEYAQAGYIDPRTARKLSDFPDLQQVESLANSVEERILNYLDKIVDDGEYTPPDQYMDLALAQQLVLQYYNQYVDLELEQDRLDMLVQFKEQVEALSMAGTPAPAEQAPMDPMAATVAPQAAPMPPPQSELIPNVPLQ